MKLPLRLLAQHCKNFAPLLAAPAALLLLQGQAKAVLTYNIFESGGNVVVQTSGSLNLSGTTQTPTANCGRNGALISVLAFICTGPDASGTGYVITGPTSFIGGNVVAPIADSASGITTLLPGGNEIRIDSSYISNSAIISSATFNSKTLSSIGFTQSTGLIGTWTLNGSGDTIQVVLGTPGANVPGPLPLLGAGTAFGWSRRLRKRISTPLSNPPQA